jgi:hypothetical protein
MTSDDLHVTVPADIAAQDKVAFGLTFRQLAIFAAYRTFTDLLPIVVWLILAVPALGAAVVLALGRRDGQPLDVWLRHGLTLARSPRLYAPGQPRPVDLADLDAKPVVPAPLRPAATAISPVGVLTSGGADRVVIACGTTNIHLRTGEEQGSLLDGFGRFLHALTGPAQLVVSARRHDLTPHASQLVQVAPQLPNSALRAAATDHAAFLAGLDSDREPLRRQVLAVLGERAADTAIRTLSALGVDATVLDGPAVTAALTAAVDPYQLPVPGSRAVPGTPVTARRRTP